MSCGWCPETKTINTLTTPVSLPFELYCFLSAVQCTLTLALMRRSHDTIRLMFGADSTSNRSKRLQEARLERKQRELQRFGEGLALALQRLQRARWAPATFSISYVTYLQIYPLSSNACIV